MTRDEVLTKLRELKPWLAEQGIGRVRLFGSYARDEARPDSDIDLLVDFTKPVGLAFFDLERELGRRLGAPVSFASEERLNRVIRKHALRTPSMLDGSAGVLAWTASHSSPIKKPRMHGYDRARIWDLCEEHLTALENAIARMLAARGEA